jgi:hypothetical protein
MDPSHLYTFSQSVTPSYETPSCLPLHMNRLVECTCNPYGVSRDDTNKRSGSSLPKASQGHITRVSEASQAGLVDFGGSICGEAPGIKTVVD